MRVIYVLIFVCSCLSMPETQQIMYQDYLRLKEVMTIYRWLLMDWLSFKFTYFYCCHSVVTVFNPPNLLKTKTIQMSCFQWCSAQVVLEMFTRWIVFWPKNMLVSYVSKTQPLNLKNHSCRILKWAKEKTFFSFREVRLGQE